MHRCGRSIGRTAYALGPPPTYEIAPSPKEEAPARPLEPTTRQRLRDRECAASASENRYRRVARQTANSAPGALGGAREQLLSTRISHWDWLLRGPTKFRKTTSVHRYLPPTSLGQRPPVSSQRFNKKRLLPQRFPLPSCSVLPTRFLARGSAVGNRSRSLGPCS